MLTPNPHGNFHFLPGNATFSGASVADEGYALLHVTLLKPLPVPEGFDFIAAHLAQQGRPPQAVCGIELRSPKQLPAAEFGEFNTKIYRPAMEKHNLLVDGSGPMTRSNVSVEINPPAQAVLYAFCYTVPSDLSGGTRDFVLAGAADSHPEKGAIRAGETSDDAMREKAIYVMRELQDRLDKLNANWDDCTAINVYAAYNIFPFLREVLLEPIGRAQMEGVTWYLTRPPIVGLEFEVDARRALREVYIP